MGGLTGGNPNLQVRDMGGTCSCFVNYSSLFDTISSIRSDLSKLAPSKVAVLSGVVP